VADRADRADGAVAACAGKMTGEDGYRIPDALLHEATHLLHELQWVAENISLSLGDVSSVMDFCAVQLGFVFFRSTTSLPMDLQR
jgi:hypothetical protein